MTSIKWIIKNIAPFKLNIIALSALNFITAVISVMYAVFFKRIIDYATAVDMKAAAIAAIFLIGLVILNVVISFASGYIDELTRTRLGIHLRRNLMDTLLKKEYAGISEYHTGELNNRFFSDVSVVTSGAVTILPTAVNMSVRLLVAFIVMLFISKFLSVLFLLAGIVAGALMLVFRKKMKRLHKDMQLAEGGVRSSIQETVSGALLVKIFNAHKKRINELDSRHDVYKKSVMRRKIYSCFANAGMNIAYNAGFIFAFLWCVIGIIYGFISYGSLTAVMQLTGQIQGSVSGITGIVPAIYSMTASAERLMELEALNDEQETDEKFSDISEIEVCNVSFSYGREEVLKDVSLTVKKGETAAVLGMSGAGKSTLLMLILGIYKPEAGTVTIKSAAGKAESAGISTRRLFSYVPQDNRLFSGTVRDNLTMARDASDAEIFDALNIACADFIEELPKGLDTLIGENGFGLSAGQRQRLAIARALLSDAEVILFDEATSAIDEATEKRLIENLKGIQKTCVIITHRRSILSICSDAYVISDGVLSKGE